MKSKKDAEDILRRIELYNKAVGKTISIQKVIHQRLKETVTKARSLQRESLPLAAQQKIKNYEEKYAQSETLGFILGHLKPCKLKDDILSNDMG